MSVSSTTNKVIFLGSGTTGPFDFDFRVFDSSDLVVEKYTIATGVTSILTETTDYTVTIDGDGTGAVTTVAAVTSAYRLIIRRVLPVTQEIDYVEGDKFPAETHEEGLDRSRMIDQQLQEQIDRSVKVSTGSTTDPDDLVEELITASADAIAAKDAAVVAQGLAEDAKDAAVIAQGLAEDAADSIPTKASQVEAEAGTADDKYMTPLKTAQAITALAGGKATELAFVNADLSTGVLTVTHNKGLSAGYTALVTVVNNSGAMVIPDQINTFAANSFKVDLTSFGTLTGTWYVTYIVKG